MGLANESVIKDVVDLLTKLLNLINWITSAGGEASGAGTLAMRLGFTIVAFKGIKALVNKGLTSIVASFSTAGTAAGTSFWSSISSSLKASKSIKTAKANITSHLSLIGGNGADMATSFNDRLTGLIPGTEKYNQTL
jgi:hypothetical protein